MGFLDNTGVTRLVTDLKSRFTAPKSIAYVESTTAKTNHAAGDHFMIGEQLKRATSAIATGETIGATNSADDTVQAQIDTLRDSVYSIHSVTLEGTTNSNGILFPGYRISDLMCFGVRPSSDRGFVFISPSGEWAVLILNIDMEPVVSTSVTYTLFYLQH